MMAKMITSIDWLEDRVKEISQREQKEGRNK